MRFQFRNGRWHVLDVKTFRLRGSFKTLAEASEAFPGGAVEVRS